MVSASQPGIAKVVPEHVFLQKFPTGGHRWGNNYCIRNDKRLLHKAFSHYHKKIVTDLHLACRIHEIINLLLV